MYMFCICFAYVLRKCFRVVDDRFLESTLYQCLLRNFDKEKISLK